ncbi:MAG TPA: TfoX/Sxy family protein [Polyangia bacterium]|nr:TfoX/Sxy family protein [Polyangia bacterium]HVZ88515.1 TfoX/Sxy family protein [Polyangia bacterium]
MTEAAKRRAKSKRARRAGPTGSATQAATEVPPIFREVAETFADVRGVTRRRMFSTENAFSVNGRIFAMLVRGALVVKLPKERVDDLVETGKGKRFDPRHDGRLMKEWVVVEAGGLPWVALAKEAHGYVWKGKR